PTARCSRSHSSLPRRGRSARSGWAPPARTKAAGPATDRPTWRPRESVKSCSSPSAFRQRYGCDGTAAPDGPLKPLDGATRPAVGTHTEGGVPKPPDLEEHEHGPNTTIRPTVHEWMCGT